MPIVEETLVLRMSQIVATFSIKWDLFATSHTDRLTFDPLSSVECDLALALRSVGADSDEGSAGHRTVQPSLGPSRHGRRTRLSLYRTARTAVSKHVCKSD